MKDAIVILGAGVEGQSAARFFIRRGFGNVTLLDAVERAIPEGAKAVFGSAHLDALAGADIVVRSPGIRRDLPLLLQAEHRGAVVTSGTRIFLEGLPMVDILPCPAPVAGVTGSNGKTTCTTLLHRIMERAEKAGRLPGRLWLGGNIGTGVLDFLDEVRPDDLVLLELSSFQLQDLERSPSLGIVLNVTPNHLDLHASFEEYAESKRRIVGRPGNEWAVLNTADAVCDGWIREHAYAGKLLPFGAGVVRNGLLAVQGVTLPMDEVAVKTHPETLAAAVVAALKLGASEDDVLAVLRSFTGVEHRLELIRELDGVRWYDDSANTTPESAVVALRAFDPGTAVVLLGGSDKGTPFDALAREVVARRARVVLLGQVAPQIASAIRAVDADYPVSFREEFQRDFAAVMDEARRLARPGDVVLLSTACASFDMFRDYKDRAARFTAIVEGWS